MNDQKEHNEPTQETQQYDTDRIIQRTQQKKNCAHKPESITTENNRITTSNIQQKRPATRARAHTHTHNGILRPKIPHREQQPKYNPEDVEQINPQPRPNPN